MSLESIEDQQLVIDQSEGSTATGSAAGLLRKTQRFLNRVEVARPLVPEAPGALSIAALNAPRIQALLERAVDFLDEIDQHYGRDRTDDPKQDHEISLDDIGAMISVEVAGQEIADLAYLTCTNTRACVAEMAEAIAKDDVLKIATLCDSGLRRLHRGLVAVQNAMCQYEGWEAPERRRLDLAASLKVRRLFWEVRRIILVVEEPTDEDLPRHLSNIMSVLDVIRSHSVYPLARIDDRVYIKRLVRRISRLLQHPSGFDPEAGRRLWQDAASFAKLLVGINNRQEIREHDREVIEYGCRLFAESGRDLDQLPVRLVRQIENLVGLDPELDQLIVHATEVSIEDWKSCFERLKAEINGKADEW